MSTEFTTEPKIRWEDFLACGSLTLKDPPEPMYVMPHKLIRSAGGTLWAYREENGSTGFERFGRQDTSILATIARTFGVLIYDEYGLKWPEESGG